jgi:hypothetical protein
LKKAVRKKEKKGETRRKLEKKGETRRKLKKLKIA